MNHRPRIACCCLALLLSVSVVLSQKMKPEELVAKHLEAFGDAQAREEWETNVIEGEARLEFIVGGSGGLTGTALFYSQGPMFRLNLGFQHPVYGGEDIVFDGKDFVVRHSTPAARSPLGEFLHQYNSLLKEGLLGSVLSTAWPLTNIQEFKPKLRYEGLKDIDDQQLHRMRYEQRKGGQGVRVRLFFEPETCRHLMTTYDIEITSPIEGDRRTPMFKRTIYKLQEQFSDFVTREGLSFPSKWNIRYSQEGDTSMLWEWSIDCAQITVNEDFN